MVAVDGKSARGARTGTDRPVHLLAAFDAAVGVRPHVSVGVRPDVSVSAG
jgi:hypothetical protein